MEIEHDIEEIRKFAYRYIAMNCNSHYEALRGKFNLSDPPNDATHCIFDYDLGEVVLFTSGTGTFTPNGVKGRVPDVFDKSFVIKPKYKLEFLDPYKTEKKIFVLQSDKIEPQVQEILDVYQICGIWLAFTYSTGSKKRMVLNKNMFGKYKIIGTREFNLEKILLDL